MGFLKKHLEKKQVQKYDLENCEQGGVPSVPSVPSELEKPASIDINCDSGEYKEIEPAEISPVILQPEAFEDNWSDELSAEEISRVGDRRRS